MEGIWQDLRFAARVLLRTPRNTVFALAILSLGIGANTATFSAVNHVLLRPLPFPEPDRLIRVRDAVQSGDGQVHPFNMNARDILALRERTNIFDGVAGFGGTNMTMTGSDAPERLSVVLQTAGNEQTLKAMPAVGRTFTTDELQRGISSGVAIISDSLWKSRFGSLRSVTGSSIRLDDRQFTIIGVMPPQYAFPYNAQVWIPNVLDPADRSQDYAVWGHMASGLTLQQVRERLGAVANEERRLYSDLPPGFGFEVETIQENLTGNQTGTLRALAAIVSFLLLTSCVNVAALMLARSVTRRREFAIRRALGAGTVRHLRQLLAEGIIIAVAGGTAGLLIAQWLSSFAATLIPEVLSGQLGLSVLHMDRRVVLFTVAISLGSALIAAIIPAFGSWKVNPQTVLSSGGRTMSGGHGNRLLNVLIVAEIGFTFVLLAGAGLLIHDFLRLQNMPLGFNSSGLLTMELMPPANAYPSAAARSELVRRLATEATGIPGASAAISTVNPLGGGTWAAAVISEDAAAQDSAGVLDVNHRLITPGLLETMGIPLLRGRNFNDADRDDSMPVAIVSSGMARRLWPGKDAVGQRVRLARLGAPWVTVVGVAGDVNDAHDPGVPLETWYLPYSQQAESAAAEHFYLMVRTRGDPLSLVTPVEQAIWRVNKTLAPYGVASMDRYYADSIRRERLGAGFMFGFAVFGLILAALGVYGVMAFGLAQRTAEFGIRIALGGQPGDILSLVLRRGMILILLGSLLGAAGAIALNRVLAGILTQVGMLDFPILLGALTLILIVGIFAAVIPALRASRLDPGAALQRD